MIKKRFPGFTLIELLVVIAIIGLLSSLAVINLNSARGKARDARRVNDIKQLSTILEIEATVGVVAAALVGCTGADALTTSCTGPGEVSQFVNFSDPATPGTPCASDSTDTCGYSISKADGSAGATVGNYQICFWLEEGSGSLGTGLNSVIAGSQLATGCN